ncbi:hypothetical protein BDW22DRAFT_1349812 [Trametopsis cervina]|nr:hypothetical protein BDW22DRAFT_1349812 [Trametopsis cervina]
MPHTAPGPQLSLRLPPYRSTHLRRYHPYPTVCRPGLVMSARQARERREAVPRPIFLLPTSAEAEEFGEQVIWLSNVLGDIAPDIIALEFAGGSVSWNRLVIVRCFLLIHEKPHANAHPHNRCLRW